MIEKTPSSEYGEFLLLKSPHKFSKTPPRIPGPAARLGEHNEPILRDLCGYSIEKIQTLREQGILVDERSGRG
jgi:crotonobetainyl-CoA:carnitine CoA-transferase CaiB-like acyl-CoA transferase